MARKTKTAFIQVSGSRTPCSYITGETEQPEDYQFARDKQSPLTEDFNLISRIITEEGGHKRAPYTFGRCINSACGACKPLRVNAQRFKPNRTQRKTLNRNDGIAMSHTTQLDFSEHHKIFSRYINDRHTNPELQEVVMSSIASMAIITKGGPYPYDVLEFRDSNQKLLGAVLFFLVQNGIYGGQHYFDPNIEGRRSFGQFMIMSLIAYAKKLGRDYVYMGPWIDKPGTKMSYKSMFRPAEILQNGTWEPLPPGQR